MMLIESLGRTPDLRSLDKMEGVVVGALRHWVAAGRLGRCPIAAAGTRLGSRQAGAHLHLLLEEIGAAWPDPFAVSPPCCPRLSHDESSVADMLALARRDDRPRFDALLADMLPAETRERLFLSARVLARMLESA